MPRTLGLQISDEMSSQGSTIGYDEDYFAWTEGQAEALRQGRLTGIDIEHLAEELDDLGRSVKREIESRLLVLIVHLLKWKYQPDRRSGSWKGTIVEQRRRLRKELEASPSLKSYPASLFADEYDTALIKAAGETDIPEDRFPDVCPFTIDDILDPNFYPDPED